MRRQQTGESSHHAPHHQQSMEQQNSQEDDLESVRLSQADELSPPSSPEPETPFQNRRRTQSLNNDEDEQSEDDQDTTSVTPNVNTHQTPYVTSNSRRKDLMYTNRYSPQTPGQKKKAMENKLKRDFPDAFRELDRREEDRKKKREFCPDSHGSIAGFQFTNPGLLMLGQSALHRSGAISSLSTIDPAFLALHSPEKRIEILNSMIVKPPPLPPKPPKTLADELREILKKKRNELAKQDKIEPRLIMTEDTIDLIVLCRESMCMGHELVEKIKENYRQTIVNLVRAFVKKKHQLPATASPSASNTVNSSTLNETSQSLEENNHEISQLNNSVTSQIVTEHVSEQASPITPSKTKPSLTNNSTSTPRNKTPNNNTSFSNKKPVSQEVIELDSSSDSDDGGVIEID